MAKCVQCSQELAANAAFCVRCGTPAGGGGGAQPRRTVGDDGLFGVPRPVEVKQLGGSAQARKTESAEHDGFGVPPPLPRQPLATDGAAPSGARKTQLDEGGGFGAGPTQPLNMRPQSGGVRKTVLDEGPSFGDSTSHAAPSGARPSGPVAIGDKARIVGWMVSYDHNPSGQEYVLRAGKNAVGSGRDNPVSLFFDRKVSERHATILWRDGRCAVKDETSSNGTFVNGDDIGIGETSAVKSGDSVRFGDSTFLVFLVESERSVQLWPQVFPAKGR